MIRIRLPRKPAEIGMTALLIISCVYFIVRGKSVTGTDRGMLILSGLVLGYFLLAVLKDRITLYGWSLASIIWGIPAFYVIWIFLRETIFSTK
jgi:hypothetical protein